MDRIGTKKGFSLSIVIWSVAAMAHAWAVPIGVGVLAIVGSVAAAFGYQAAAITTLSVSVIGFIVARFALGLGEAGNFPASIKTVAEWFPKKERALATGIFNSGTNVGALATPLLVPLIVVNCGWYEAFIITGAIGFIWLIFWLIFYRRPEEHPRLSKAELDYIQSDPAEPTVRIPWRRLFPHRQTWAFAIGKFLTDPIWWVYLFWLPDFLHKQHGLDLKNFGIAARCHLHYRRRRQHRRRLDFRRFNQTRLDHQRGQKNGDADLRAGGRPDCFRLDNFQSLDRGFTYRHRGGGASGLVGKYFHDRFGYVSETGGRLGRRHRRHGGRYRRHVYRQAGRVYSGQHRQLRADFRDCGFGLSGRTADNSPARAEARTGANLVRTES